MKAKYEILKSKDVKELCELVENRLECDYELVGGLVIQVIPNTSATTYYQTVMKPACGPRMC